jgi:hypothetical protein
MNVMDMVVFSAVFWGVYHLFNAVRDYRQVNAVTRAVMKMSNIDAKLDSVKRVK